MIIIAALNYREKGKGRLLNLLVVGIYHYSLQQTIFTTYYPLLYYLLPSSSNTGGTSLSSWSILAFFIPVALLFGPQ